MGHDWLPYMVSSPWWSLGMIRLMKGILLLGSPNTGSVPYLYINSTEMYERENYNFWFCDHHIYIIKRFTHWKIIIEKLNHARDRHPILIAIDWDFCFSSCPLMLSVGTWTLACELKWCFIGYKKTLSKPIVICKRWCWYERGGGSSSWLYTSIFFRVRQLKI